VKGLKLSGIRLKYKVTDERPAVVLDDVGESRFSGLAVMTAPGVPAIVEVTNTRKREPDQEYVKETPYKTTTVTGVSVSPLLHIEKVTVDRPSPATPPDALYTNPTAPSAQFPYAYAIPDDKYPLPLTVYRPSFDAIGSKSTPAGSLLQFTVAANTPVAGAKLSYSAVNLPSGASFDAETRTFSWTPGPRQAGTYTVTFTVDDGILPESTSVSIAVLAAAKP